MEIEIIDAVNNFNKQQILNKINSEKRLLKYIKILSYATHVVNFLSIILSVLSESIADKIVYAVIVCSILNSILSFEIVKANSNLLSNNKMVNAYLKQMNIDNQILASDNYVGISRTPINTPMMISV